MATMTTTQSRPPENRPNPVSAARPQRPIMLVVGTLAFVAALITARSDLYQPGSDLGYYMGVVGALMMVTLLLYPLRKHVRFLYALGQLKHWFRLHMVFGISGPILILLHSKFSFGSLNAAVALACMLLVAGSGVIGRFIYRRIHHGLYGQRATLKDLHQSVGDASGEINATLAFVPSVAQQLRDFAAYAQKPAGGAFAGAFKFMTLGFRAWLVKRRSRRVVRRILSPRKHATQIRAANTLVEDFLRAVQREAQFSAYERLFSLWHVLHTPFVYMLFISGVVHVIAVHMY